MHLRNTDANRTRRRIPPALTIKSSSARPNVSVPGSSWGQGIQRQRVEKSAPGFGVVGEHANRIALTGRRDRDAQHVAQRVRLVGGYHQHSLAGPGITYRGGGRQSGLSYPALADKETDPGLSRRTGITQPSTRFFRSFNAPSINLRSALRLSIPIMGTARSTASS